MTPLTRTPQQRDRRFARVRRITQTIFLGSGALSVVMVGFLASITKPTVKIPATTSTTVMATTTTSKSTGSSNATATVPTTVPVTTTTTCYSTPSGQTVCN